MPIKSIKQAGDLKNKRVLVRVDFNVPIDGKKVLDDTRLFASLPTIQYLLEQEAKVILVTHIGRPDGFTIKELRVAPVAKRLSKILDQKVKSLEHFSGELVHAEVEKMIAGDVIMLENIRFSKDEEKNTDEFAQELAHLADIFVLDGFAVAHRASASIVGVTKYLPSYAGLLLYKEIMGLDTILKKPKKPFVAIVSGAKIETKIPIIDNILPSVDQLLIGGGILNTILWSQGYLVGASLLNKEYKDQAKALSKKRKIIMPLDVVVGSPDGSEYHIEEIGEKPHGICQKDEAIFDIGPKTIELFSSYIEKAKTLVWNGALGYFEQKPYDIGTMAIAKAVADQSKKSTCFGVIGGGETVQSMKLAGGMESIDLVSTGGGAMLEVLSGKKLPGIVALEHSHKLNTV